MIETIEQALEWLRIHSKNLGGAYVVGDVHVERLLRAAGAYFQFTRELPDSVDIVADQFIGAINAFEAIKSMEDLGRTLLEATRDSQIKSKKVDE